MSHFSGSFGIPIQFEPNPFSKLFQPFLSELNSSSGGILISGTSPAPNLPRAAAWLVLESCPLHGLEGLLPHGWGVEDVLRWSWFWLICWKFCPRLVRFTPLGCLRRLVRHYGWMICWCQVLAGLWFQCLVMSFLGSSGSSQVHKAHVKCRQIQQPNPFNYFQPMILASRCRNLSLHKTPMWQTHINPYANPTIYILSDIAINGWPKWSANGRFSRNSIGQLLPCRGCCWRCMPKKIPCHYLVMAMHPSGRDPQIPRARLSPQSGWKLFLDVLARILTSSSWLKVYCVLIFPFFSPLVGPVVPPPGTAWHEATAQQLPGVPRPCGDSPKKFDCEGTGMAVAARYDPKVGVPQIIPKSYHVSFETHGFGDPIF